MHNRLAPINGMVHFGFKIILVSKIINEVVINNVY
jgi:hypothetical protein